LFLLPANHRTLSTKCHSASHHTGEGLTGAFKALASKQRAGAFDLGVTAILGNGAFKPNISTQVGGLYAQGVKWCPVSTLTGFDSIP
jgi:hypothetical protein